MKEQQSDLKSNENVSRANWTAYGILLFSTFVTIEAMTFQAPALPSIVSHFGVAMNSAALIILIYYIAATTFAPIMGRLADTYGRKRMMIIGLSLFSASEFVAAFSPTFSALLAARFVQGLGVACILPVIMAYIGYLFPSSRRGMALGIFTCAMSIGATVGAVLGGFLVDSMGWPVIYWLSGALGVIGLSLVVVFVPDTPRAQAQRDYDLPGAFCLLLMVGGLLSFPTAASKLGAFSIYSVACLGVGLVGALSLWRWERNAVDPIIDTDILGRSAFLLPALIYLLNVMCLAGLTYSLAFFIGDRPGGSASQVGVINMTVYGCSMLFAPIAGKLSDHTQPRTIVACSLVVILACMLAISQIQLSTPLWVIATITVIVGAANGMNTPPLMKLIIGAVPQEKLARGTGLFTMFKDFGSPLGATFGLAVFGGMSTLIAQSFIQEKTSAAGVSGETTTQLTRLIASGETEVNSTIGQTLRSFSIDGNEMMAAAHLEGIGHALPWVTYVLALILAGMFLLSLRLPRNNAQTALKSDLAVTAKC